MDTLISLLVGIEPQHWLVIGLALLIAEMATGTTYLLWPAIAAFITGLIAFIAPTNWVVELVLFAVLVIVLTIYGRPIVNRFRTVGPALNERGADLIGTRGVVTTFAAGVGAVKINDTVWRATSEEALREGESVEVAAVHGVTLQVKRAG